MKKYRIFTNGAMLLGTKIDKVFKIALSTKGHNSCRVSIKWVRGFVIKVPRELCRPQSSTLDLFWVQEDRRAPKEPLSFRSSGPSPRLYLTFIRVQARVGEVYPFNDHL